jgi:hypothetical protein
MEFLDHTVSEKFVELEHRSMIVVEEDPERLLQTFETYQPPTVDKAKWVLQFSGTGT